MSKRMKWNKKGIIYKPNNKIWWQHKYAILPTPIELENCIRVFFSSTCENLIGRITYIDLEKNDLTKIKYIHDDFIVDKGSVGTFDENGLNPSSVISVGNKWFLYYAGYQRHLNSPYSIFTGLLVSDNCKDFKRIKEFPILDRCQNEMSVRSAPTVLKVGDKFKMWYVSSNEWEKVDGEIHKGKMLPRYSIKYGVSENGIDWKVSDGFVFELEKDEFGFGRPNIFKKDELFYLFYSIRSKNKSYRIGFATSLDGIHWDRKDSDIGIDVSESGWDSEMICYPSIIEINSKIYMFYNGNNNGETGFGLAELLEF